MNALTPTFDASVPAFLRNANFLQINQKGVQGLSSGAPPRLSFRGSRFRFVAADGTETPVTENNGVAIDVVIVDASEHVSKFFYDKAYDPNADDMSPACFSDNGVGPSIRATKPQSLLCQTCPKNAWGSKITPQGTQVKACSDVKKIVVIPASNTSGPAYMLGIPGASLKTWSGFVTTLSNRGIPIPAMVVRLSFDATAEYPKLMFEPKAWLTEEQAANVQELFGSEECDDLVGRKDTAISALATPNQAPGQVAATITAGGGGGTVIGRADQRPELPAFLDRSAQPQQATPTSTPQAEAAPRRRGRRPAAEAAAQQPAPAQPAPAPVVQAAPPAGAADLNALLDKVMAGR